MYIYTLEEYVPDQGILRLHQEILKQSSFNLFEEQDSLK